MDQLSQRLDVEKVERKVQILKKPIQHHISHFVRLKVEKKCWRTHCQRHLQSQKTFLLLFPSGKFGPRHFLRIKSWYKEFNKKLKGI